ncbi:DUF3408 domain-containing protein [Chryseobacterium sp. MA9]|uniref:DUF3408 domain-containing protein n=1 Tax=Chryseobacterium sp. MA9 TaxID=2966625 RepID=UPI00210853A4|nr:DUF3408 domain-containing protein [Chryseobacterium sp. MA9]UTX48845.1 DUF3408 domain-containing protein [Chryseobacterium sp. MA9]
MRTDKEKKDFEKPHVDEEYLMQIISGDQNAPEVKSNEAKESMHQKPREKARSSTSKKAHYEDLFLINRFPSGRSGKVVYIRPEYHERLLRIVQLSREERTTLYSYIDNILEQHFLEYGNEITEYFNNHFKPIL